MIEPCKRPIMFELTHTADLSRWNGDAHDKDWLAYLAGVRRFVDKGKPTASVGAIAATRATAAATDSVPIAGRGKRIAMAAAAVLGLLLIAGGIQWALTRGGSKTAATPTGQETAAEVSLAVLPFVNLSSDPEQEYFSDGLSEELLNQLAQVKKLRLTARTSSFSFKGKNEDVRVIGEKLGVGNVLEGSVRKDGTQLRITAQLINTRDGSHLWSQTYDRELAGVFALQEEIAKDVAQALSIRLDVGEVTRAQGGTNNVEAYDKYLQAAAVGRQGLTLANKRQETQLYRDALALDPNFALAGYALYQALTTAVIFREESAAATREQADILARMEAQTPDAWWTANMRVARFQLQHRWSAAEATISAAQTVGSLSAERMRLTAAEFLFAVGRIEETIPTFEANRRADPLSLSASVDLQRVLHETGRDTEAQAEYVRSRSLEGNHGESNHHALFRLWRSKDPDPKLIKAQFDLILENESLPMALTRTLARNPQDAGAARAAIRQAFDAPENQDQIRMFVIALYAAHYGDMDLVLAAMHRRFIDMKAAAFAQLWYPYEGNLRADPRFKTLLRDLGLVDYYRKSGHWPDYCKPVGSDDFECR
jgi:TolB-like protein